MTEKKEGRECPHGDEPRPCVYCSPAEAIDTLRRQLLDVEPRLAEMRSVTRRAEAARDALRARVAKLEAGLDRIACNFVESPRHFAEELLNAPPAKPSALGEALAAWRGLSDEERWSLLRELEHETESTWLPIYKRAVASGLALLRAAAVKP